jgi:acyl-CoA synthetase (AMP-forming)/AMP-acid ligase II
MSVARPEQVAPTLVWEPWLSHALVTPDRVAVTPWSVDGAGRSWRWGELVDAAKGVAQRLRREGVRPGAICATILRDDPRFYPIYLGVVLAGAVPAVLAYPNARLHPEKFRQGLIGMLEKSGLDWILTESALLETLGRAAEAAPHALQGILLPFEWSLEGDPGWTPPAVSPESPALLQHSSGTTGLQKPVMLSHRAVLTHLSRYAEAIALSPDDKVVSWLPLYHDMGLIAAFHLPLRFAAPIVQLDPFEWVKIPTLMLEAISATRSTLAWLPNFAYNLIASRADSEALASIRLDSVRALVNCSEPVRAASHAVFLEAFGGLGLRPGALSAAYAMAEATFAVTQTRPGTAPRVVAARRASLAEGRFEPAQAGEDERSCVSSGEPIEGCRVRIVSLEGEDLPDGTIGEVWVRSESLFSGYRNHDAATQAAISGDWFRTGDLGFRLDNELFVTGRLKDIIIVAGKNLYPEDIEDSVSAVAGVVPGRVAAFGLENLRTGTEEVCVVAETQSPKALHRDIRIAIVKAGMGLDVSIGRVVLVPPRSLFKTSSGKICRKTNKARLLDGGLSEQAFQGPEARNEEIVE